MFDVNGFKKSVKEWMREHPNGTVTELADYCEDLLPQQQFSNHMWLVEQTTAWYKQVLAQREAARWFAKDLDSGEAD